MSLVCGVRFYPLARRRLLRYRILTAIATSVLLSVTATDTVLAGKTTNTPIVTPDKPAVKAPPVPQWMEERLAQGKRCKRWEPLFREFGLPVQFFSYFSFRESRCATTAVNARFDKQGRVVWTLNKNGTFDSGLLQINSGWRTLTSQICKSKLGDLTVLFNPRCNVAVARYLYDNGGLRHWGYH